MKSVRRVFYFIVLITLGTSLAPLFAASDKNPSDDPVIPAFHSLGSIEGQTNIYRCASPVMNIATQMTATEPTTQDIAQAKVRLQRLYDLGIRTIVSFQGQGSPDGDEVTKENDEHVAVALEKAAAKDMGMTYIAYPAANKGAHSFEDMSDQQVFRWLDMVSTNILNSSKTGGVVFHCKSGHDRTGLVAAYLRIKYQHWPVDEAIAEMRRDGHHWTKFRKDDFATSSWHEDHLRAIAAMLNSTEPPKN